MPEDTLGTPNPPPTSTTADRLHSWKEIAAHLKRNVTTVRRWEKREGLPVHRHLHEHRDSVYANAAEIDAWWEGRRNHLVDNGAIDDLTLSAGNRSSTPDVVSQSEWRLAPFRLPWLLATTFLVAGSMLITLLVVRDRLNGRDDEAAPLYFAIPPPLRTIFGAASLSPDQRQLAFTASSYDGATLLFVRSLDTLAALPLPETEGATFPFWSPTSDMLGFFAGGKLWTVNAAGGSPRFVADAPNGRGGTWNRQGTIVFAPDRSGALFRVSVASGPPTPLTAPNAAEERGHLWPEFLPDGNRFLFLGDGLKSEQHRIFVGALDGTAPKPVLSVTSNAVYADGFLFFARNRQLWTQPFDAGRLTLSGEPVAFPGTILQQPDLDHKADVSVSGRTLVYRSMQSPTTHLVWRDRTGRPTPLTTVSAEYTGPALSPQGHRIAVDVFNSNRSERFGFGAAGVRSDISILDSARGNVVSQLAIDPSADFNPVWSPNGLRIAFSSNRGGKLDLYQRSADGSGTDELLFASDLDKAAQAWSPDGRYLLFATFERKTRGDFWLLPMNGPRTAVALLRTELNVEQAQISPDGRWLSYTAQIAGRSEVFVQSFPTPGESWRISTAGGGDARWRPDGRELFYVAENRQLMAVGVTIGATFEHGAPVPLFDTGVPPHWYEARNLYDVSRDGRFLFMAPVEDDRSLPLTFVLNWWASVR